MIVGYVERDQLPVRPGDRVVIPHGTRIRSTRPGEDDLRAKRTYTITAYRVDRRGDAYAVRKGHRLLSNPEVVWVGSGGYWVYVDINDVILPGHDRKIGDELEAGEPVVAHYFGPCELLFVGENVVAGKGLYTGSRVRAACDDAAIGHIQEFFGDEVDLADVPVRDPSAMHPWIVREMFARPRAEAPVVQVSRGGARRL